MNDPRAGDATAGCRQGGWGELYRDRCTYCGVFLNLDSWHPVVLGTRSQEVNAFCSAACRAGWLDADGDA